MNSHDALRGLAAAIILRALKDLSHPAHSADASAFLYSDQGEDLAKFVGIERGWCCDGITLAARRLKLRRHKHSRRRLT